MKKCVRRGFTLVELLIVFVVIGVLAAMMMLSGDEAASSARAAAIIAELSDLKVAANAYYVNNVAEVENPDWEGLDDENVEKKIWKFFDRNKKNESKFSYSFGGEYGTPWFVWCRLSDDMKVKEKLAARKNTVALCAPKNDTPHSIESKDYTAASNINYVGMQIR